MPSYSGKRTYEMTTKKWGGGGRNQRRDDRRPPLQNRIAGGGSRPMVNPWENGVTPGMQSGLLGQGSFSQPLSSSYLLNSGMNRGSFGAANYGGGFGTGSEKMRRLDRMGGFDDQRGRGLLPSPSNAPLLGVAPPHSAFAPPGRGSEFLQQRMGNPWESPSFRSGVPRGLNSGYYPSNRGRQDNNNRKFLKAKRPQNKSSSSPSASKSGSSSKEGRGGGRTKGSTPSSSSKGENKDKESSSSSAHSKSGKQGDSPLKRERSDKDEEEKEGEEDEKEETVEEEVEKMEDDNDKKETDEKTEEERKEKEKQQLEDPFPVKALYCHICELDSFSSKKGYIRHLQGITHAKMAEVFHAKNAATLELLNISAKLAEMRQRDKVLRRTGKKGQPVMKTTEQILVQKYLRVGSCCGTKYKSPFGLEEHKLSIHHLKAKYLHKHKDEEKSEEKPEEGGDAEETKEIKKEPEEQITEDSHDEVLKQSSILETAQKEAEENPMTMNDLPIYNPSEMLGLEFVSKELRFRCSICKGQGFKSLENHCQSHSHFDNIASHLNKVEDLKREEKRKQEEAEEEAKKEQEKLEKEKEEQINKEKLESERQEEEEEEDREGEEEGLPSDYITVDESAKDKSDDEEMDEDAILDEEEERILNAKEDDEEEEEEDEDAVMGDAIFEEVGEVIDFDGDLKKQLENGDEEDKVEEEEEVPEVEIPQKKPPATPRGRRGRARGRGRWGK